MSLNAQYVHLRLSQSSCSSGNAGFLAKPNRLCRVRRDSNSKLHVTATHAVALPEVAPLDVRGSHGARVYQGLGNSISQGSSSSSATPRPAPVQQSSVVEVHFQVQYSCQFGQHLAIVGSPQAWHAPAAVPMTWSQGDVWQAVLPLPVGCEVEYKYIVMSAGGDSSSSSVDRWQEGPNNKLTLTQSGVLMHVTDTWGQDTRQVRQVGPRLQQPPPHNTLQHHQQQQQQHVGDVAGGYAGGLMHQQQQQPRNNITAFHLPTNSSSCDSSSSSDWAQQQQVMAVSLGAASAVPVCLADLVQQQLVATGGAEVYQMFDQFDQNFDQLQYEDEEEDQHWPAEMLEKAAAAATATTAQTSVQPPPSSPLTPSSPPPPPPAAKSSSTQSDVDIAAPQPAISSSIKQFQQQQRPVQLAELLPLLAQELQSALTELSKHPTAATATQAALISEGQAVLAALQQQQQQQQPSSSAAAAPSKNNSRSSSANPQQQQQQQVLGRAAGSPSSSPGVSLASGDDIAAALLSDDCEEACFCMVDAICSCSDWDLTCSCEQEEDPDAPCTGHQDTDSSSTSTSTAKPVVPAAALATAAAIPATTTDVQVQVAAAAAASAAAARAAAFADVQSTLERSAQLLEALRDDPGHPLLLEADRKLAFASSQLQSEYLLAV